MLSRTFTLTVLIGLMAIPDSAFAANGPQTLLEFFFLPFRYDQTAYIVFFGMIIFAILLVLDFRRRVYRPLEKDIDQASRAFSRAADPESFASIYDDVDDALGQSRFLAPIWSEYRETMTDRSNNNGGLIYQNTKRPKDYFTADAISKQRGSMNSLDKWPNIFVGFGLLITFLGLMAAVFDTANAIKAASTDVDEVLRALENLLTVASIKFLTSVSGIACSIGLTLFIKHMQSTVTGKLNGLHDKIERCLEFLSLERLQIETIDAINGISTSISTGVAEGVKGVAGTELRLFADEMKSIASSLSKSKHDIEGFGETYAKQVTMIDDAFKQRVTDLGDIMDKWVNDLKPEFSKASDLLNSSMVDFAERIESVTGLINDSASTQAEVKTSITSATKSFENAASSFSEKLTQQSAMLQDTLSAVQEMIGTIQHNSESFNLATEKTVSAIRDQQTSYDTNFQSLVEQTSKMKTVMSEQVENLTNAVKSLSEINTQINMPQTGHEEEIIRLVEKIEVTITRFENTMSITNENIRQLFNLFQKMAQDRQKPSEAGETKPRKPWHIFKR